MTNFLNFFLYRIYINFGDFLKKIPKFLCDFLCTNFEDIELYINVRFISSNLPRIRKIIETFFRYWDVNSLGL